MKHLYEYINEKLVLNNKTKIRQPRTYAKEDFKNISDFKSLIDIKNKSEHVNFYLGYVLTEQPNIEKFLCGWIFIEYWDKENGGTGDQSEFFYIVNEEQFNFLNEINDLKKKKINECYEAPEWLIDILYKFGIADVFGDDFNAFIITVDDFCNYQIIKKCWNDKLEKNIMDLQVKLIK